MSVSLTLAFLNLLPVSPTFRAFPFREYLSAWGVTLFGAPCVEPCSFNREARYAIHTLPNRARYSLCPNSSSVPVWVRPYGISNHVLLRMEVTMFVNNWPVKVAHCDCQDCQRIITPRDVLVVINRRTYCSFECMTNGETELSTNQAETQEVNYELDATRWSGAS